MTVQPGMETVELLDQTWRAMANVCGDLDEAGFNTETDCPGWTVKDMLSHVLGTERTLRGEPPPDIDVSGEHIRNELGRFNERWVTARRTVPGAEVLAEFRTVTAEQTAARRLLTDAELAAPASTPFGEMPLAQWLDVRLFDCFAHEQDIRRALLRPGSLDGEPARRTLRRGVERLPRVVARAAKATGDGTRVEVVVDGDLRGRWQVEVSGGRGRMAEAAAVTDASLRADLETFLCLVCGRWSVDRAEASGRLVLSGDLDLARRVAGGMPLTP